MSFPNQQSYGACSLPSIDALINSLELCPNARYGCSLQFASYPELVQHQQTCSPPPGYATRVDTFASIPPSDSDLSSTTLTPSSSRAPSPSREIQDRRSLRSANRIAKKSSRRRSSPFNSDVGRKAKKNVNEQLSRSNSQRVQSLVEDFIACCGGWFKQEQSGGNGNAAGLQMYKINLAHLQAALLCHYMHQDRCEAIRTGTVGKMERKIQEIADATLEDDNAPYAGTFLQTDDDSCYHKDNKSKECAAHGHPDWRVCRLGRRRQTFRAGENTYMASLGITREQAWDGGQTATLAHRPRGAASSKGGNSRWG